MVFEVKLDAVEDLEKIVREMVAAMVQTAGRQRWYNLKDACEYKGVTYGTVKCDSYRQPLGGRPDALINGRKMWKSESIEEWLDITDENIEEYIARCRGRAN